MTRMLVIYGTTDGQTRKIARAIGDTMRARGADVDVVDAGEANVTPGDYAGIIVAASVRGGRYRKSVLRWVRAHVSSLRAKPTAFVSVSLGVLQRDPAVQREVAAIVDRFLTATAWQPDIVKHVAGALRYRQYNLIIRFVMKRIAKQAGGDTDTSRDYEYTDWPDVRAFADRFLDRVMEPARVTAPV